MEWIKTDDALPKTATSVLIWDSGYRECVIASIENCYNRFFPEHPRYGELMWLCYDEWIPLDHVKYWMPMPEGPEE